MKKILMRLLKVTIFLTILGLGVFGLYKYQPELFSELYSFKKFEVTIIDDSDNVLADKIEVKGNSYLRILDIENKEKDLIRLQEDITMTLDNLEDSDSTLFIHWEIKEIEETIEEKERKVIVVSPKTIESKDYTITLKIEDPKLVKIKENDLLLNQSKIAYTKDTEIVPYLDEIDLEIHQDYKGDWHIKENDKLIKIDDYKFKTIKEGDESSKKILDSNIELVYITYQDKNDNYIDDFTETFTVKFNTSVEETINSRTVKWEDTIELPILKHDSKVFYEWYSDKEMKVPFTEHTKVRENLTLYAKFKNINTVMNESVEEPIYRKDILDQVEKIIAVYNYGIDENYNKTIEAEEKTKAEEKEYNRVNNIFTDEKLKVLNFHNPNHNKLYIVSFLNEDMDFLFGIVSPYGRTIKVYDTIDSKQQEIAVRQNTTVVLDETKLLKSNEKLLNYKTEYYKINETVYVKVSPNVDFKTLELEDSN